MPIQRERWSSATSTVDARKKNICLDKLDFLIHMHPKRSGFVAPSSYLEHYEDTVRQCDVFLPYMRRMEAQLAEEGIGAFNIGHTSSRNHEHLAASIVADYGNDLDKAVKKDMFWKRPIHFLRNHWLR